MRDWWPFGTRKQQQQELIAADGARGDEFGYSVAVSGNTTIIGAAYKNSYQGAVYVFGPRLGNVPVFNDLATGNAIDLAHAAGSEAR